jgi:hypothetical protein
VHALLGVCGLSKTCRQRTKTQPFIEMILHAPQFFTSPTLPLKLRLMEKRQKPGLAKTDAEKLTLQKVNFARKNKPDKKA